MSATGRRRLQAGARVDAREVTTAAGEPVQLPARDGLTHLQFRRFAGCAICAHHLRPFVRRRAEIQGAGITELVVFRSAAERVEQEEGQLPFVLLPDPDGDLYAEFGVESAVRSLLQPQAWLAFAQGVLESRSVRGSFSSDDHLGLPADFLIRADGELVAVEYGDHAAAGWDVDELLRLAAGAG